MDLGHNVIDWQVNKWLAGISPIMLSHERVYYAAHAHSGFHKPKYDHILITDVRVWVGKAPVKRCDPAYMVLRSDLLKVDVDPAHSRRVVLTVQQHEVVHFSVLLLFKQDRQAALSVLNGHVPESTRPVTPPPTTAPPPPRPKPQPGFVEYSGASNVKQPVFDSSEPPKPGDHVPSDCVWATTPYPGPLHRHVAKGFNRKYSRAFLDPVGRPLLEIWHVLGDPVSVSHRANGQSVIKWKFSEYGKSYSWSLLFDRYKVCARIVHKQDRV